MAEKIRVLDYRSGGVRPSRFRTFWRMVVGALLGGASSLFGLGYFWGDVDDHGIFFLAIGLVGGLGLAFMTRKRCLPRRVAVWGAGVFFVMGGLIIFMAGADLVTGRNIFTGERLEGMDALLPFLWLMGSLIPLMAGMLFILLGGLRTSEPGAGVRRGE